MKTKQKVENVEIEPIRLKVTSKSKCQCCGKTKYGDIRFKAYLNDNSWEINCESYLKGSYYKSLKEITDFHNKGDPYCAAHRVFLGLTIDNQYIILKYKG